MCGASSPISSHSTCRSRSKSSLFPTLSASFGSGPPRSGRSDLGGPGWIRDRELKDEVAMDGRRARRVLGVPKNAGPDEIRRAFRARALVTHPDHGGNAVAFAEVRSAFELLRASTPTS